MLLHNARRLYKIRPVLEIPGIENIWIELKIRNNFILFGTFYRPPNSGNDFWDKLEISVDLAFVNQSDLLVLTADFNEDQLKTSSNKIKTITRTNGLQQLINEPTHYWDDSSSLIDLILISESELVDNSGVGEYFIGNKKRLDYTNDT